MAANKWAIMGGIALNVEYTRKYAFDATAAAKVTAKLVAVPPPTLFQEALQVDLAGRAKRLALLTAPPSPSVLPAPVGTRPAPRPSGPGTPTPDDDMDFKPLILSVEEKAGIEYTLDDGVTPPRAGQVSEDGVLTNRISTRAKSFVVTFADDPEPLKLVLDEPVADADEDEFDLEIEENLESWEEAEELEEPESESELAELTPGDAAEDGESVLSLMIVEKAGKAYTLDDGILPASTGVVADDGALVQPVSPDATTVRIQFEDEAEPIEVKIAS